MQHLGVNFGGIWTFTTPCRLQFSHKSFDAVHQHAYSLPGNMLSVIL